jgi:hypothetical protein
MSGRRLSLIVLAGILLIPALAQDAPQGQAPRRGGGDPTQARERMLNNVKEQMGLSEEQWRAFSPKAEKVMTLQRELRGGGMGGRGGDAANPAESKVAQAQRDLRTALENKDTPPAEITQKLAAYREAREKAREELKAAQKALAEAITPRQEAVLVANGLLE